MNHHYTRKTIAKVCSNNQECSVQEPFCHTLPDLSLTRIFLAIYFVNINLPQERAQVLLTEKEFSELPEDSPNILKRKILLIIWKN